MTIAYAAILAMSVVVALLAVLVVGLLRSHADILRQLNSLGAGIGEDHGHGHDNQLEMIPSPSRTQTPDLVGVNPGGDLVAISASSSTEPVLLAFLSTSCSSCTVFWENLDGPERYFGGIRHRVVIVTLGEDEESPTRAQSLMRGTADVVMTSQGWLDYQVPGAPYFMVLDRDRGVVGQGSATTFDSLEEFLTDSANDSKWDRRRARKSRADAEREARIDEELRKAGLEPGDPRLYPDRDESRGGTS